MKRNTELLKRLRTRFLRMRHPEHFDMSVIAAKTDCGAAMCMIGHTLELAGCKMRLKPPDVIAEEIEEQGAARSDYEFILPSGRKVQEPFSAAARLLGLTSGAWNREAESLFYNYSLKTPKQAAKAIEKYL